jgi:hypothetical protein
VFEEAAKTFPGSLDSIFLVLAMRDVPVDGEFRKAAVGVVKGNFLEQKVFIQDGDINLLLNRLAIGKHSLGPAPGAGLGAVIDYLVALFTDAFAEIIDHGFVHKLHNMILADDIDAVGHGIEHIKQFVDGNFFHGGQLSFRSIMASSPWMGSWPGAG